MSKYKLGAKAGFFYDPTTQKKVMRGAEVKFSEKDLMSVRTKAAINSGHLIKTSGKEEPKMSLLEKFEEAYAKGEKAAVVKDFKLDELRQFAEERGFEVDQKDTKDQLAEALIEDYLQEGETE